MNCPTCQAPESRVVDSRLNQPGSQTRRRRECVKCGARFTTYERVEDEMPAVIKKDGRREEFSRDKIQSGVQKALSKRPITRERVEQLVQSVEKRVQSMGLKEVNASAIGALVMKELRDLDSVAYVRFASVYREFTDVREFVDELSHEVPHAS